MKKTLFVLSLVLVLSVTVVSAAGKKGNWTGWVSDAKCGAKGAKVEHAGCAEKCVKGGQKAVLVTESGDVLEIVNQDLITAHAGHHVKVNGTLDEAAKTITVEKVSMVEAKAPEKKS